MVTQRHYTQIIAKVAFVGLGLVIGTVVGIMVFNRRARVRMEVLANVIASGHQKLMVTAVRTTLAHMAGMLSSKELRPEVCQDFAIDLEESRGFFAVLAVGNMQGEAICTSDKTVKPPLPTMKDRLYFERVKEADELVSGEYTISKTTGKPTIHYAYPIFDAKGERKGFVMAAVDLTWFINPSIRDLFVGAGVELVGADHNGKVLFMYPSDKQQLGKNTLSADLIAAILRGDKTSTIAQSYTGEYRMYAYQWSGEEDERIVVLASVGISNYWYLWLSAGLLGGMTAWVIAEQLLKRKSS